MAAAARFFFIFYEATNWWATDTYLYADQAREILNGNWPSAAPNGYPLLIAGLMTLFGDSWDLAGVLLNMLFSLVVVALVYRLSLERSQSHWIAFLAALLAAVWPSQLVWVRVLYTEVPATFFLCCGLFLHWRRHDVLGGLFLGAAFLIRPTLAPIAGVIGLVLLLTGEKRRALAVLAIPLLCVFAAQMMKSTPIAGNDGSFLAKNIILSNYSITEESRSNFEYRGESVPEAIGMYFNNMIENPAHFAALRFGHFWELWGAWPDRLDGRSDGTPRSAIRNAILGLQFPLFILGVWAFFRRLDYLAFVLIVPALVITFIHTALFALPRYNYPAVPFMIVLAADSIAAAVRRFAPSRLQSRKNLFRRRHHHRPAEHAKGRRLG